MDDVEQMNVAKGYFQRNNLVKWLVVRSVVAEYVRNITVCNEKAARRQARYEALESGEGSVK